MNNSFLLKYKHLIIASPHLDDAFLSCSSILTDSTLKSRLTVVNVFTTGHSGPYTLSARRFLSLSGTPQDANSLFQKRISEDQRVFSQLKVNHHNLSYSDALFRRWPTSLPLLSRFIPELVHLYPTYRWHILNHGISRHDSMVSQVQASLSKYNLASTLAIIPYGVGGHVDHLIVRQACERLFPQIIYYLEFPYTYRHPQYQKTLPKNRIISRTVNYRQKTRIMKLYQTQFSGLFPNQVLPPHTEQFILPSL